ncbi:hypothetical protein GCM10022280_01580 [Sphingomonas swuensis]|uniref:Secreted protein n=1 Tax=Sphingomonas swuensis TaxID=977800 RepID=A0ABP7S911_9SPHN
MLVAAASMALAASSPAAPVPVRASVDVLVRIVAAVEVRNGRASERHQRRRGKAPDGSALTLIEFE